MFSANFIKGLAAAAVFLFLAGCGGGAAKSDRGGKSTAPTAEQIEKLNDAQSAAKAAEAALYERKLERIELERQLED